MFRPVLCTLLLGVAAFAMLFGAGREGAKSTEALGYVDATGDWSISAESTTGFAYVCTMYLFQSGGEFPSLSASGNCGLGSTPVGAASFFGDIDPLTGSFFVDGSIGSASLEASGYVSKDGQYMYGNWYDYTNEVGGTFEGGKVLDSAGEFISAAEGGAVSTGTGDAVEADLYLGAGALSADTFITIHTTPGYAAPSMGDFLPGVVDPWEGGPSMVMAFELGPTGTVLNTPGVLIVTYQESAIGGSFEDTMGVLHFDGYEYDWMPVIYRDPFYNVLIVEVSSFSPWSIYEPVTTDSDGDGCRDVDEQLTNAGSQLSGGRRNPLQYWDVYDLPTGTFPGTKDHSIAGTDFFALLTRFGATGAAPTAASQLPGYPPVAEPAYHPVFDRNAANSSNQPVPPVGGAWNTTISDGAITGTDFFGLLTGFGMTCVAP